VHKKRKNGVVAMKDIKTIVFGALFNHSYRMLDNWGDIADNLLDNKKYFPGEFFPNITLQYTIERELSNPNGTSIRLNASNLIFTQVVENDNDFDTEYKEFKRRIIEYIEPQIIRKYNLVTKRLGVVYSCELSTEKISKFAKKYFNPELKDVTDFRFSKKEPTKKGSIWANKNDYINKIYTVGSSDDSKGINYDFQLHFDPPNPDVRDMVNTFIDSSLEGFNNDVISIVGD